MSNKKLPAALNTGFKASIGDYLTWTSDDNIYEESAILEMLMFLVKNKKYSLVYSNYRKISNGTEEEQVVRNPDLTKILFGNIIGASFLYTRNIYEEVGDYCVESFLAEDYQYWGRVFEESEIAHLDKCLYQYRCHEKSLTNNHSNDMILEKANPVRERILKVFIESPSKSELHIFYKLDKSRSFQYQDLLLIRELLEKLIRCNKILGKICQIEFTNFLTIQFKEIFRKSTRKYGFALIPVYWKFNYRKKFDFQEFKFFVLLFLSWIKNRLFFWRKGIDNL